MINKIGMLGEILIALGAFAVFAGVIWRNYCGRREHYQGRTEATVVDIEIDEPDRKGKEMGVHDYFYPVFAYYAGGTLIRQRYRYGSNPCQFYKNQKVRIRYKLSNPAAFVLERKNPLEQKAKLLYYGGLCLILAGGAIFMLFANRKWLT